MRQEYKQGKGNVIRRMFQEVDALCYIMVDGDDTYPMENAREMADLVLERNSDMVVGDRLSSTYFEENKRPFHNMGNSLVRASINALFKSDIRDIMTGYRAFSYRFVKTFPVLSRGFEIETEMTIHAVYNNMQVDNVVITYRDRPEAANQVKYVFGWFPRAENDFPDVPSVSSLCIFWAVGAVAVCDCSWVLYSGWNRVCGDWSGAEVPDTDRLRICRISCITVPVCGLILHNLGVKDRRDFEFRLQIVGKDTKE